MDGAPGELAVAHLAPPGRAEPASLANREWGKIVVEQERLLVGSLQRIDELLVLPGAERGDRHRLGLAAREQRRPVRARQHSGLAYDRAHGAQVAAVDATAGIEDVEA